MWDTEGKYPDVTPSYCRECAPAGACATCPRPRLLPEAVPGMLAYLSVATQWRYAPSGRPTGLAYGDCLAEVTRRAPRIAADTGQEVGVDDLMDDVQTIERATLEAVRELDNARARAQGSP